MTTVRPDLEEQQDEPAATGAGHTGQEPSRPARRHPRRRWGRTVVAGVAVAAAAGVAASAALGVFGGGGGGDSAGASSLPPATAEVARTTLVATARYDGTLGYGPQTTWSMSGGGSEAGGEGSGGSDGGGSEIVTWLPEIAAVVARGEPVFSVDAEPVVLMYGSMPFYRPLSEGDSGPDVEQLEENLDKLGYEGFTVDDEFTWATAEVVEQWQQDVDLPETGQLDPTRAMVADGAIRVADHLVALGDPASGQVMSYAGTDQQITVELDVVDEPLVEEDLPVTVTTPDSSTVDATVTDVSNVATGGGSEGGGEDDESLVIDVTITVDDAEELGDWEEAPVKVDIETDRREDVLAVPLGALVALGDDGHGVRVVEGGETSYLPVETGLFADGMVEIIDGEVVEGTVVGVPS